MSIFHLAYQNCIKTGQIEDFHLILRTLSKHVFDIAALDEIARTQSETKAYRDAVVTLHKMLSLAPNNEALYSIRSNLAKVLNHLNEPHESLRYSNANAMLAPSDDSTKMEQAFSYYLLGDYAKSEAIMRELLRKPDLDEVIRNRVLYNLGSYDLEHGNFKDGLRGFIGVGHNIEIWKPARIGIGIEAKTSEDLAGADTLMVMGEGGIGDEVINARFVAQHLRMAKHRDRVGTKINRVVWVTNHESLVSVLNETFAREVDGLINYDVCLVVHSAELRKRGMSLFDAIGASEKIVEVGCMSLPIVLDIDKNELWYGEYLIGKSDAWMMRQIDRVVADKGIDERTVLVAVKWQGNTAYEQDLHRSIDVDVVREWMKKTRERYAADGKRVLFLNLQGEKELQFFEHEGWGLDIGYDCHRHGYDYTMMWLVRCAEVFTSCTSVAHVAGAMVGCNAKVWVFPPIACYYVWLGVGVKDARSWWYGDRVVVNRQTKWRDWSFVLA